MMSEVTFKNCFERINDEFRYLKVLIYINMCCILPDDL